MQTPKREKRVRANGYLLGLLLGTMSSAAFAAAMSRDEALAVFMEATPAFAKFCTAGPNDAPTLPEDIEDRTGNALAAAENVLTKRDDPELLKALVGYVDASDCSADESRAFSLGAIFHHRPDALQTAITDLPDQARCRLVEQLDWGWQNESYDKKLDAKLLADRASRLKKLKDALPLKCEK
jgi:hypothetical protein